MRIKISGCCYLWWWMIRIYVLIFLHNLLININTMMINSYSWRNTMYGSFLSSSRRRTRNNEHSQISLAVQRFAVHCSLLTNVQQEGWMTSANSLKFRATKKMGSKRNLSILGSKAAAIKSQPQATKLPDDTGIIK